MQILFDPVSIFSYYLIFLLCFLCKVYWTLQAGCIISLAISRAVSSILNQSLYYTDYTEAKSLSDDNSYVLQRT